MNKVMRNRLAGTLLLLFVFLCTSWAQTSGLRKMIDLSGTWSFALDPHGKGEQEKLWNMDFAETVTLPGTTDSNTSRLERKAYRVVSGTNSSDNRVDRWSGSG